MRVIDLAGQTFGDLTVIARAPVPRLQPRKAFWRCRCICGRETVVIAHALHSGNTQSCGCRRSRVARENKWKHGHAQVGAYTPEYTTWCGMISRCENPKETSFVNYGGRGIRICDRWRSDYTAFFADMGPRPSAGHSIDRINNEGHYEPGNCRWATRVQQNNNTRRSHK